MRHVKPGRGPSMMGAIFSGISALAMLIMGISMMGSGFGLEGIIPFLFSAGAACMAVYNFKNSVSKNRYSDFDVTDPSEEPDPLNEHIPWTKQNIQSGYCPYCGKPLEAAAGAGFVYCPYCGKKL